MLYENGHVCSVAAQPDIALLDVTGACRWGRRRRNQRVAAASDRPGHGKTAFAKTDGF